MALAAVDRLGVYQVFVSLNHPNSAAIYGLEGQEGREGEPLARCRFALQITQALEAAHEQGIIPRDLKPARLATFAAPRPSSQRR